MQIKFLFAKFIIHSHARYKCHNESVWNLLHDDIKLLRKCWICNLYQELQNEIRIFSVSIYFLMYFLYIGQFEFESWLTMWGDSAAHHQQSALYLTTNSQDPSRQFSKNRVTDSKKIRPYFTIFMRIIYLTTLVSIYCLFREFSDNATKSNYF